MMEWWQIFKEWFLSLGTKYGVDPYLFGGIYMGAIPFFFIGLGWTVKNIRNKKSVVLPVLFTGLCFISAYLYLIVVGKNIPVWVYIFIAFMIAFSIYSTIKKVKKKSGTA